MNEQIRTDGKDRPGCEIYLKDGLYVLYEFWDGAEGHEIGKYETLEIAIEKSNSLT